MKETITLTLDRQVADRAEAQMAQASHADLAGLVESLLDQFSRDVARRELEESLVEALERPFVAMTPEFWELFRKDCRRQVAEQI